MKLRRIIMAVALVVIGLLIYIGISTIFINQTSYRNLAGNIVNNPKNTSWKAAEVTLVKLGETPCRTAPILSAKISRSLLVLNGGYAVRVEFPDEWVDLLGPVVLYFNPFTKQCIGGDLRM